MEIGTEEVIHTAHSCGHRFNQLYKLQATKLTTLAISKTAEYGYRDGYTKRVTSCKLQGLSLARSLPGPMEGL
jgi:hypothetical protein